MWTCIYDKEQKYEHAARCEVDLEKEKKRLIRRRWDPYCRRKWIQVLVATTTTKTQFGKADIHM